MSGRSIITDPNNVQLTLKNGNVPVAIQDQHSTILGIKFYKIITGNNTLASDVTVGDYTVEMTAGHSFVANDFIQFSIQTGYNVTAKVLGVSTNTLTLDTPLPYAFSTTETIVEEVSTFMNVDGSSTPQMFRLPIVPIGANASVDITGIRLIITDVSAMDDGTFGGQDALTRGIIIRKFTYATGSYNNYTRPPLKTNGDVILFMDNHEYNAKAPSGEYGFTSQWMLSGQENVGVVIRVTDGDELQILIQDDLTDLSNFEAFAYGHVVV